MRRRAFIIAAGASGLLAARGMATAAGADTGVFERAEPAGATDGPQRVYFHRPANWRTDGRIVMVLHGVGRNASGYRDDWIAHADRHGFLLACPEFSQTKFPRAAWYNEGGLRHTRDPELRSFAVPERVFSDVRQRFGATADRYSLYGHSAGSQFVHRALLLAPASRVDRAVAANAGYYTVPTLGATYPYGLGGLALPETQIARYLGLNLLVLLGEADTNPAHPDLLRNADADLQGIHRLERGTHFFEAGKREAARRGVAFGWRIATVPGVPHSNRRMAPSAADHLFA